MIQTKGKGLICLLALLTLLVSAGCGKEAKTVKPSVVPRIEPIQGDVEARLSKQSLDCDNGQPCPGGIAKVVIVNKDSLRICTGFLVNSLTLATSSSCLPQGLWLSTDENRCQKDVYVYFARSGFSEARRVNCARILLASPIVGADPVLWRSDISYIELSEPVYRRALRLDRSGTQDNEFMTVWKVDAENDDVGVIRKEECQHTLNSYVNPLATSPFSPNITLSGCSFKRGNTGAMVLSSEGRLRGILSESVDKELTDFLSNSGLQTEPLWPMTYVSNAACLPSVLESDPVTEIECLKDLDYRQIDRQRSGMLDTERLYGEARAKISKEFNALRPYFRWNVELYRADDDLDFSVRLVPICMNKIADWIGLVGRGTKRTTYSDVIPDWKLSLGFDRSARLVTGQSDEKKFKLFVQFSPRSAWNTKTTDIFVWREGTQSTVYRDVPECLAAGETPTASAGAMTYPSDFPSSFATR
ncbi:MAG: hypothetical protein ACLGG7_00470 [Bacteriovoracia bacterium]